jgi:hypothetical protein
MTFDQKAALRAVIETAREWRAQVKQTGEEADLHPLMVAVDALEAALPAIGRPNEPHGFVLTRPWELVAAGWFVKVPNGEWWEVTGTALVNGKQEVSMRKDALSKVVGPFPREPKAEVKVRRGTHTTQLDDAIEALSDVFGGVAILEDKPPWDE